MTQRANHFKMRLFEFLPWIASQNTGSEPGQYLCTPVPRREYKLKAYLTEYTNLQPLSQHLSAYTDVHDSISTQPCLRLLNSFWDGAGEPPYEALCVFIERSFCEGDMLCECCDLQLQQRCPYCIHAVGWHRCLRRMRSDKLALADFSSFVRKRNTLYHVHHDTEVTILSMLRQGTPTASIHGVLEQLLTDGAVTADKH